MKQGTVLPKIQQKHLGGQSDNDAMSMKSG